MKILLNPIDFTFDAAAQFFGVSGVRPGMGGLKARDNEGNTLVSYVPLDLASGLPNNSIKRAFDYVSQQYGQMSITKEGASGNLLNAGVRFEGASNSFVSIPNSNINTLGAFTFRCRFETSNAVSAQLLANHAWGIGTAGFLRWRFEVSANDLFLYAYNSSSSATVHQTTTNPIVNNTMHEAQFTYNPIGDGNSEVTISADGSPLVSESNAKLISTLTAANDPGVRLGGWPGDSSSLGSSHARAFDGLEIEEARFYGSVLGDDYTPMSSLFSPFTTSAPTFSKDMGKRYVFSFSNFTTQFQTNVTYRIDVDDDNTPNFTGSPLTLGQVQVLSNLSGRYFHIEVTLTTDGSTFVFFGVIELDATLQVPTKPTISNYTRSGASGSVDVAGMDETETARIAEALYLDLTPDTNPAIDDDIGNLLGNGTVTVDYTNWTFTIAGVSFDVPQVLWGYSEINGLFSQPSIIGLPAAFTTNTTVISDMARTSPATTLRFTVSGLPGSTSQLAVLWTDGGNIQARRFVDNGVKNITGLDVDVRFTFIFLAITDNGQFMGPFTEQEPDAFSPNVPNEARLNSVTNDGDGDAVTLNVTPPGLGAYDTTQIIYRKLSDPRGKVWISGGTFTGTQGASGDKQITGLDNNNIYEFVVYAQVTSGPCNSAPSLPIRVFVTDKVGSIAERIIVHIKATLETITVANGFNQDIKQVLRLTTEAPQTKFKSLPSIEFDAETEGKFDDIVNVRSDTMRILVTAFTGAKSNIGTALSDLAGDIEKALEVDGTRNGIATDTVTEEIRREFAAVGQEITGAVEMAVEVDFRHFRGDPYLQKGL